MMADCLWSEEALGGDACLRGLGQDPSDVRIPFPRARPFGFASALIATRTDCTPRGKLLLGRECLRVESDLPKDVAGARRLDARDAADQFQVLPVAPHALRDHRFEFSKPPLRVLMPIELKPQQRLEVRRQRLVEHLERPSGAAPLRSFVTSFRI